MRVLTCILGSVALMVVVACSDNSTAQPAATREVNQSSTTPAIAVADSSLSFSPHVDAQGNISFPKGFRDSMVHLGSWFVPDGEASGFHDVYTERKSVDAFRTTGVFPDGATVVKELRAATPGTYTTGAGVSYANSTLKQWFVMVKDGKGRFAGNPLWGDGWGWALFTPDNLSTNAASAYQSDCLGCHIPAKATDWIYTEAYPTLGR